MRIGWAKGEEVGWKAKAAAQTELSVETGGGGGGAEMKMEAVSRLESIHSSCAGVDKTYVYCTEGERSCLNRQEGWRDLGSRNGHHVGDYNGNKNTRRGHFS